jgi:3-deoxy-D-manno-octulosonic-acid transferase
MIALRLLYRFLWWLAAPVALVRLALRSRREPAYADHVRERFGFSTGRSAGDRSPLIWIHAVSVGETRAAKPLIDALQAALPGARFLMTHMTPAGRATGVELFGDRVLRCYLPYDMHGAVRRFLRRWRPSLGVVMETEVWPELIEQCRRAGIPLTLANGRMSERSHRRAARFGAATRPVFGGFAAVFAQTPADRHRLAALGARDVQVLGNLKFDFAPSSALVARGRAWRSAIGARPVWVAASTRGGEEALLLHAFRRLARPDALLILVPRHPQRFSEVASLVAAENFRLARRSEWAAAPGPDGTLRAALPAEVQVLLGDSMGELTAYYAAADVAFIGGSLLPLGGQNLIEACAVGVPVLIGPHTFNFAQASVDALAAGAALRVVDPDALGDALRALLDDSARREAMAAAGRRFAAEHRGAARRYAAALLEVMDRSAKAGRQDGA